MWGNRKGHVVTRIPPEKVLVTKVHCNFPLQVLFTLTLSLLHKMPGVLCYAVMIKCAQHWHCSCLHIPYWGPLSLQHPAPVLHNPTYVHAGSMWERKGGGWVGSGGRWRGSLHCSSCVLRLNDDTIRHILHFLLLFWLRINMPDINRA